MKRQIPVGYYEIIVSAPSELKHPLRGAARKHKRANPELASVDLRPEWHHQEHGEVSLLIPDWHHWP